MKYFIKFIVLSLCITVLTGYEALAQQDTSSPSQTDDQEVSMDRHKERQLILAVRFGHEGVVRTILNEGVNPNIFDSDGLYPLHLAVQNEDFNIVQLLLGAGADVDIFSPDGYYPLHLAITMGNMDITEALVNADANADIPDPNGNYPIHLAINSGSDEIIGKIAGVATNVNVPDPNGLYPIHLLVNNIRNTHLRRAFLISNSYFHENVNNQADLALVNIPDPNGVYPSQWGIYYAYRSYNDISLPVFPEISTIPTDILNKICDDYNMRSRPYWLRRAIRSSSYMAYLDLEIITDTCKSD